MHPLIPVEEDNRECIMGGIYTGKWLRWGWGLWAWQDTAGGDWREAKQQNSRMEHASAGGGKVWLRRSTVTSDCEWRIYSDHWSYCAYWWRRVFRMCKVNCDPAVLLLLWSKIKVSSKLPHHSSAQNVLKLQPELNLLSFTAQFKVICWKLYFTTVYFLCHHHHSHSVSVFHHLPADIGQHKWVHETTQFTRVRKDDETLAPVPAELSGTCSPFPEFGIHRHLSFLLRRWRLPGLSHSWHLFPRGHLGNGRGDRVGQLRVLGCFDSRWELN